MVAFGCEFNCITLSRTKGWGWDACTLVDKPFGISILQHEESIVNAIHNTFLLFLMCLQYRWDGIAPMLKCMNNSLL